MAVGTPCRAHDAANVIAKLEHFVGAEYVIDMTDAVLSADREPFAIRAEGEPALLDLLSGAGHGNGVDLGPSRGIHNLNAALATPGHVATILTEHDTDVPMKSGCLKTISPVSTLKTTIPKGDDLHVAISVPSWIQSGPKAKPSVRGLGGIEMR